MQPTNPWSLVLAAVVSAALAWLAVLFTFAGLPPLPWTALPTLGLLAVIEFIFGRSLRARIGGRPGTKPVQPLSVPRIVALAKASSLAAAIFGGLALGLVIYTLRMLDKPVPRHDALTGTLTVVAALALALAALYLERSCRAPKPPDDDDDDRPSLNGDHSHWH